MSLKVLITSILCVIFVVISTGCSNSMSLNSMLDSKKNDVVPMVVRETTDVKTTGPILNTTKKNTNLSEQWFFGGYNDYNDSNKTANITIFVEKTRYDVEHRMIDSYVMPFQFFVKEESIIEIGNKKMGIAKLDVQQNMISFFDVAENRGGKK